MRFVMVALLFGTLAGCARHYVQGMESHQQKLMLTTVKETYLLFLPLWTRQTVQACDLEANNALKCQEAQIDYGASPL